MNRTMWILTGMAMVLAAIPLVLPVTEGVDEPFTGADSQAMATVSAIEPGYTPWFEPLWKPPSAEIEGFLFALQAAMGAGLIGYYVGFRRGMAKGRTEKKGE